MSGAARNSSRRGHHPIMGNMRRMRDRTDKNTRLTAMKLISTFVVVPLCLGLDG
jgi:hypothetical protein